jgi:uncharacterized protein (DUF305 family)
MKRCRLTRIVGTVSVATMLTACSEQSAPPTAPSRLDTGMAASSASADAQLAGVTIASAPASDPSAANFEVRFMTGMIDHHQMAVMTSTICVDKAVNEELRTLCQSIIASQSAEIDMMQSWLEQWYGMSYEPMMKPGGERTVERLSALSGGEFEIAFMEMMIKHHAKAVTEGRRCLNKAAHTELRSLCENIIETQSAEIAMMEAWLCQWYGRC